jgi:hypothetical protein
MMTAKIIKARIDQMPPAEREACEEIAEHIRMVAKTAGRDTAINAVFLVAFELKETVEQNAELCSVRKTT